MTLSASLTDVTNLNVRQDELLKQALRCAEHELYRAAHVMAWAAYVDCLQQKLASDGLVKLRKLRTKWIFSHLNDLVEKFTEFALLEASRDLRLLSKADFKALSGDLSRRNECAHPSDYLPGLNETLGYVSGLVQRIRNLSAKGY
ncbi:hypothetical protein FDO65_08635 [Nakamurella flava]|uniref:HEPN domain-containing protein n=1 Tax=Nakamurella flava TaxID=2576308 RepID=A0A4U6QMG7_9ACTN|nr:hypothetical protein [Nakamurella flava]TKV61611.1 hypothetical protein FDO65_08635 [Nakamurella flava]